MSMCSIRLATAAVILCMLIGSTNGQSSSEWRKKLIPLVSTSEDVERVLGKPIYDNGVSYSTSEGYFSVYYSIGVCDETGRGTTWKVHPGTLVDVGFSPKDRESPEKYEPNLASFKQEEQYLVYGYRYTSPDKSLVLFTKIDSRVGELLYLVLLQPGKDKEKQRCKPSTEN
jgi:hypothetical protein